MFRFIRKNTWIITIIIWLIGILAGVAIGWANSQTEHALLVTRVEAIEENEQEEKPIIDSIPVLLERITQMQQDVKEIKQDVKELKR